MKKSKILTYKLFLELSNELWSFDISVRNLIIFCVCKSLRSATEYLVNFFLSNWKPERSNHIGCLNLGAINSSFTHSVNILTASLNIGSSCKLWRVLANSNYFNKQEVFRRLKNKKKMRMKNFWKNYWILKKMRREISMKFQYQ